MKRTDTENEIMAIDADNILIELPTGFGKTKIALELIRYNLQIFSRPMKVLIVVPRLVLIDVWKKEIHKWRMDHENVLWSFSTYAGLHNSTGIWDMTVFDEVHHMSERCMNIVQKDIVSGKTVMLSATVPEKVQERLSIMFTDLKVYRKTRKDAFESGVLPRPEVYLIPLHLGKTEYTEIVEKHIRKGQPVSECTWPERWSFLRTKRPVRIRCTASQKLSYMDNMIEWYKKKYIYSRNEGIKNRWLQLAGERLKWLSEKKEPLIVSLLDRFKDERTLTFCNNIAQTERLGKYCINSRNKDSKKNLEMFNSGRIKHITACNMLNEGMNLSECKIGIYANLNSSEVLIQQRLGRILRHRKPIVIIPYYEGTREQELVEKMIKDYDKDLIMTVNDINEIRL